MTTREIDEMWMRRAIQLAQNGELTAHPNPMVGAVIVAPLDTSEGGAERIIGEGYHHAPGEPHAEVNAVRSVRPEDLALLPQSTIYVTLEPCAHYGRTPPCAELLIRQHIGRVVVGCVDPFTKVGGRGIAMLREAGIPVEVGVLNEECLYLIRHFVCAQVMRRPFITLKWAASADGYIDLKREMVPDPDSPTLPGMPQRLVPNGRPARLSTPLSQIHVHHLRASHQAILVGRKTLELDRPSLNVRHYGGRSPLRCVLGSVGEEALNQGYQAYADIDSLLEGLRREGVQSLLVEGGAATLQSFIERDLWDEAWEEHSEKVLLNDDDNDNDALRYDDGDGDGDKKRHGTRPEGVPAPEMPHCFKPEREVHFGVEFYHWKSPVLQKHYVNFLP